ncbi:MAG: DNA replication/repair protein RecF [Gammaproteobacteria bacterium]|nr:DNA replication/repair protein RecF [Gammaproteobacteria bacterium]
MRLQQLQIQHFRNLEDVSLTLSPGFNYLYGANGAGKTAILEAGYLLARGRSFRTPKIGRIITHGEKELVLRADVLTDSHVQHKLAMSKHRSGQTRTIVDGQSTSRASTLARHLPIQILLPGASDLVYRGPTVRREFLDWGLFHVEPLYLQVSKAYRRVLIQRNAWLKGLVGKTVPPLEQDPWFTQILRYGTELSLLRSQYTAQLVPLFESTLDTLAPELNISTHYSWGGIESEELAEKRLEESYPRDVKFGMTHRGPHRGDLQFSTDGLEAADMLSRGQAKLVASAALLAQASLQHQLSQERCLFLIDDFGAELDGEHWRYFVDALQRLECQVIATSTDTMESHPEWFPVGTKVELFHVKHGMVGNK